ncbi:unnamed protein product [Diatraea saccharalis]|uniref:Sucrose-6-phosphate hydrolase n=1 Tax=Diatraea saccharalis TaxID=40085 RepID=A0A9N9QZH2_9NEOP|nr:unnamed protein product [Diatraea saccharalis]
MAATCYFVFLFCVSAALSTKEKQQESEKSKLEQYINTKLPEINQRYWLHYHIAPPVGWMNDPNGFSFFKNEYHMFYQFYPYKSEWGPMHWGHSSSPDLVNWKRLPTALHPEKEQCFSGSAVEDNGQLVLMYTAHVVLNATSNNTLYNESQYLAYSADGINFEKYSGNPVLSSSPNGSSDFRDPKVWKYGNNWYVVIGSKTNENRGRVLLYRSTDMKTWEFLSVIAESAVDSNMGYMWECPDFFELDGKFILLMSPQGMKPVGDRYKNTFQTGYIVGNFSYETFKFVPETEFQEIDYGHDFYATQTLEKNGTRYMVAWFGMWEVEHPEAKDGWCGAMTIVRELRLLGDRVLMKPVHAMTTLRDSAVFSGNFTLNQVLEFDKTAEIILNGNLSLKIELLVEGRNGGGKAWIKWDPEVGKIVVDRGSNDTRQVKWIPIASHSWRLFLDTSSLELFCGEGEVVFSTRVYPNNPWKVTNLSPQTLNIQAYHLKRSVPYYNSSVKSFQYVLSASFIITILTILSSL